MEGDLSSRIGIKGILKFLSTPSGWRATQQFYPIFDAIAISIHALRVEGDDVRRERELSASISIHALRVEGDPAHGDGVLGKWISIHALRVEGDFRSLWHFHRFGLFLSTPSGWRATYNIATTIAIPATISIHALRVEGDFCFIFAHKTQR